MITFGDLVDTPLRAIRRTNDENDRKSVEKYVNKFYFEICEIMPIPDLRREIELDLADSDSGVWLPSNLAGVLRVVDIEDGFDYLNRDRAMIESIENAYRYYTYVPDDEPLQVGEDLSITKGNSTFSAASITEDHTGEYIKFGSELGFYLLKASATFSPRYYGPTLNDETYVVRPNRTRKIVCLDKSGEEETGRTVMVHYWIYPNTMYLKTDVPVLPSTRALELMVMKEALVVLGKRQLSAGTYNNDIDDAMKSLRKLCPMPTISDRARGRSNEPLTISSNIFGDR